MKIKTVLILTASDILSDLQEHHKTLLLKAIDDDGLRSALDHFNSVIDDVDQQILVWCEVISEHVFNKYYPSIDIVLFNRHPERSEGEGIELEVIATRNPRL